MDNTNQNSFLSVVIPIITVLSLIGNLYQYFRVNKTAKQNLFVTLTKNLNDSRIQYEKDSQELLLLSKSENLLAYEKNKLEVLKITYNSLFENYISALDLFCGFYIDKGIGKTKFDYEYKNSILNLNKLENEMREIILNENRYKSLKKVYFGYTGKIFK